VQPARGPGGAEYRHQRVAKHVYGTGARQYWIFEPDDARPASAPLIIFNHGWGALTAAPYDGWIEHLVKRGNIVVYPRYQENLRASPATFTANAIDAVKSAIATLEHEPGHVKPDLERVAVVGHSAGGNVSASMVALAAANGLPVPKALMCVEPGKTWNLAERTRIPLADLRNVPATTLILTVVGDQDRLARDVDAKRIFEEATHVPRENKNFVTLVSDAHGKPALAASHLAPLSAAAQKADALDYYGMWKLFDALSDAAFYGTHREYALGDTPEQRFMGTWSDGRPVKELLVTDHP
jgi:acetyl esterase/lipase